MQASGISWRTWGTIIISFLFFAVLLLALKNVISLDDGIRHFAMAKFMAEHGLAANTGWNVFLYHGAMADLPVDPWFLYDVLLIPLTRLSPAVALKIISLIEILLISGIFLLLLRRLRTPKSAEPWYVLALFFGDFHFTHRLLLGRPFTLFTALTLAAILLIWQKKWIVLALLLLLSALLSHLFLFPLAVSLVGVVWLLLFQERRDAARSLFACAFGVGLGILLHPHSSGYIAYLTSIFPQIPFARGLSLGSELQYGIFGDAKSVITALGLIGVFLSIYWFQKKKIWKTDAERKLLFLLILFSGTGAAYVLWQRAIDLLWPVALLALASLHGLDPKLPTKAREKLLPKGIVQPRMPTLVLTIFFLCEAALITSYLWSRDASRSLAYYDSLKELPSGSRVLNVDWDIFPALLITRQDLLYATGMDPTFTYLTDARASRLLHILWFDAAKEDPPVLDAEAWLASLLERIPADYLVLQRRRHRRFIHELAHLEELTPVSTEGAVAIFEIGDRK